jgi:thiamine-phosphate pyrophosphorylase
VAIGGITLKNATSAVRAGADVLAVISAIAAAPDPGPAARRLLEVVRAAQGRSPSSPGAWT